jgi:ribosomal protein S18 acetylase RimI-like enzyme
MINIRQAISDDALGIAKVHVDSWQSAYRGLLPDDLLSNLSHIRCAERFRESIASGSDAIYVAEDNTTFVGFLAIGPCRDPEIDSTETGEIYALYLVPECWKKGIGRIMCNEADRIFQSSGYSRVVLWVFEGE